MYRFSIVLPLTKPQGDLDAFLRSLRAQTIGIGQLEIVIINAGIDARTEHIANNWSQRYPNSIRYVISTGYDPVTAYNDGLSFSTLSWVTFCDLINALPVDYFEKIDFFLRQYEQSDLALICLGTISLVIPVNAQPHFNQNSTPRLVSMDELEFVPAATSRVFFRRDLLIASGVSFDRRVRTEFITTAFTGRYLLSLHQNVVVGLINGDSEKTFTCSPFEPTPPHAPSWRQKETYSVALTHGYLAPLEEAVIHHGKAPIWLQRTILQDLQQYFALDRQAIAPTVVVNESMAVEFHDIVRRIMEHIDIDTIMALDPAQINLEIKHALLSYKTPNCHSTVVMDACDHDQGLVRFFYYLHGNKPSEMFLLDGKNTEPAYVKYRACKFFWRVLMRQRIFWLPVSQNKTIEILLDSKSVLITLQSKSLIAVEKHAKLAHQVFIQDVLSLFPLGKGDKQTLPINFTGMKVRILRWVAQLPFVRKKFNKAWVFTDRGGDADDNAEHLYRWVWLNHPEINSWYLLDCTSHDWKRLKNEGFRLIPHGVLRKLLVLNSENIISSHTDYEFGGLSREYYGDMMRWKFSFLEHGITKDDVSHWLGNRSFDLFITTSPAEYASIVADDTPYSYTTREVKLTGLPRQDKLFSLANQIPDQEINIILVMPTWRGYLVDDRLGANKKYMMANSEYVKRWSEFLSNKQLHELILQYGKKLVFMPHQNTVPLLEFFDIPQYITVVTKADTSILPLICHSVALVTDYSSIAFEAANLRRTVFYYQFDRDRFYGGDHNWREGYFDYFRDGFGPVSTNQDELIMHINNFIINHCKPTLEYLKRMEHALPELDGQSCQRVFEHILKLRKPFMSTP